MPQTHAKSSTPIPPTSASTTPADAAPRARIDPDVHDPAPLPHATTTGGGAMGTKTFVLDTNVLLHNPRAVFVFDEHDIVIPFEVIEELDHFKERNDDIGRSARETIRVLDALRLKGDIKSGVPI